jgi:hypothetical protein
MQTVPDQQSAAEVQNYEDFENTLAFAEAAATGINATLRRDITGYQNAATYYKQMLELHQEDAAALATSSFDTICALHEEVRHHKLMAEHYKEELDKRKTQFIERRRVAAEGLIVLNDLLKEIVS